MDRLCCILMKTGSAMKVKYFNSQCRNFNVSLFCISSHNVIVKALCCHVFHIFSGIVPFCEKIKLFF